MNLILVITIALLFSVFFSGMVIAFQSANKLRLELDKKQNHFFSGLVSICTQNPAQFIAAMMIGSNLALVILGITIARFLEPYLAIYQLPGSIVLVIQTIIAALTILITAELLPKIVFQINPNGLLKIFSLPLSFFYFLFYPVAKTSMWISGFILKIFLDEPADLINEKVVFSRIDLDQFVNEHENNPAFQDNQEVNNEVKLFRNALDFSKVRLREIMVPRTEIVALDIESTVEDLHQKFIETGYSRILFYDDNIDNVVGYIHHSVIFTKPDSIKSHLRKVLIVPETMSASKLLSMFIQQRLSIAIVVDEFGGTSGMVASEDILEEIFGEIEDEHDTIDLIQKKVGAGEYVFSGRLELDELNENFNLEFPENDNFETLAGFILFNHESIPKISTVITIGTYRFRILKATNTKIELIHLKILDDSK
jgi:CBS domain containing-hemolysin-like protein